MTTRTFFTLRRGWGLGGGPRFRHRNPLLKGATQDRCRFLQHADTLDRRTEDIVRLLSGRGDTHIEVLQRECDLDQCTQEHAFPTLGVSVQLIVDVVHRHQVDLVGLFHEIPPFGALAIYRVVACDGITFRS